MANPMSYSIPCAQVPTYPTRMVLDDGTAANVGDMALTFLEQTRVGSLE